MVYRMELTSHEITDVLDKKCISATSIGYTLAPGMYENSDLNLILKSLLPDEVKVNITNDDIRLKTNLTTNKTSRFTKKSFFYTILDFTQSHSGPLGEIKGFVQLIPGSYKSDKPVNITGTDKVDLKCDCINGSIVKGTRESILFSFALDKPPGHKIYKKPRNKLFKKINESVLSHITFYLEYDDHKPVDWNRETISFTCQIVKRKFYIIKRT